MTVVRRPMLADSIKFDDLASYIVNPSWVAQLKADGQRLVVTVEDGVVSAIGRDGQEKNGLTHKLLGQFEPFDVGRWVFDGEIISGQLHLFDLIEGGAHVTQLSPFSDRWLALSILYRELWKPDPAVVSLLPVAVTETEKLGLVQTAADEKREGIMLRNLNGQYLWGRRSSHLLKCKFTKEVDAIVLRVGDEGKENVTLGLIDPDGDRIVEIGRASAIGKKPTPQPMDVWEVTYLYVVAPENPRLYQPRLVRKRDDKELSECLFSQLDHAYTNKVIDLEKNRKKM